MTTDLRSKLEQLAGLQKTLENGDFLLTWKNDEATLRAVLLGAQILEDMVKANISTRVFDTGLGLSIFRDKSTRTRYAFRHVDFKPFNDRLIGIFAPDRKPGNNTASLSLQFFGHIFQTGRKGFRHIVGSSMGTEDGCA